MIQPTTVVIACAMDSITSLVFIGAWRKAPPMIVPNLNADIVSRH